MVIHLNQFSWWIMVPAGSSSKGKKQKKLRCHFCKKGGHFKKDCLKRKIWFKKKGVYNIFLHAWKLESTHYRS